MKRRTFCALVASAAAWPLGARAQQPGKLARIGVLSSGNPAGFAAQVEALRHGLREQGYVEGKNVVVEYRWAEGKAERLAELAAELVRLNVDVLVTHGVPGGRAAKQATSTVPIVVAFTGDAVAMGLVTNLARPDANMTGSTFLLPQVNAKRVELLKEVLPGAAHIAALSNPSNPAARHHSAAMEKASMSLKLRVEAFNVDRSTEFAAAFDAMGKRKVPAAVVTQDGEFASSFRAIADLAITHRIASAGPPEYANAGGLLGYGANTTDLFRRAAYFVDRILKGAKPAELPFEQPTKFDLVINQKTARALGLTIPQSVLLRADRVIE